MDEVRNFLLLTLWVAVYCFWCSLRIPFLNLRLHQFEMSSSFLPVGILACPMIRICLFSALDYPGAYDNYDAEFNDLR